jgi:hypothetical protein
MSIERDRPIIPPECVILIVHLPSSEGRSDLMGSSVGVLSGSGVEDGLQPVIRSAVRSAHKKKVRGIFYFLWFWL